MVSESWDVCIYFAIERKPYKQNIHGLQTASYPSHFRFDPHSISRDSKGISFATAVQEEVSPNKCLGQSLASPPQPHKADAVAAYNSVQIFLNLMLGNNAF